MQLTSPGHPSSHPVRLLSAVPYLCGLAHAAPDRAEAGSISRKHRHGDQVAPQQLSIAEGTEGRDERGAPLWKAEVRGCVEVLGRGSLVEWFEFENWSPGDLGQSQRIDDAKNLVTSHWCTGISTRALASTAFFVNTLKLHVNIIGLLR